MIDSALARRIEMTGWSTVVLGVICVVLAVIQGVAPIVLRRFSAVLDAQDDPMRAVRDAWSAGAGIGAWVNGLFGASLLVIGHAVARRARWGYRALTISCWASIAVLAILAKPTLAPFFAMTGGEATGRAMVLAGVVLLVAQIAAVLWFLRFWSRPEVREAFR